jgi:hypothetical protein
MTLNSLAQTISAGKFPNVPAHARPALKYSDKDAGSFTTAVLAYLRLKGCRVWRQPTEGRYIEGQSVTNVMGQTIQTRKGIFIPRDKHAKGVGDISGIAPGGKALFIEIKIGRDRQSEEQKKFQQEVDQLGGIYILTRTWDDFFAQIKLRLP